MTTTFLIPSVVWLVAPTKPVPSAMRAASAGWEVEVDADLPKSGEKLAAVVKAALEHVSGGKVSHFQFVPAPKFYVVTQANKDSTLADVLDEYSISVAGIASLIRQARGGFDETTISMVTVDHAAATEEAQKLLRLAKAAAGKRQKKKA